MAKGYSAPTHLVPPDDEDAQVDGQVDIDRLLDLEQKHLEDVQEWARENGQGDIRGEVVYFPRGDGAACYVVFKTNPCSLIHINTGDAWMIPEPYMRGLRSKDLREQVAADKRMAALFARS